MKKKLLALLLTGIMAMSLMTGCGEEQAMWERIKRNLIDN